MVLPPARIKEHSGCGKYSLWACRNLDCTFGGRMFEETAAASWCFQWSSFSQWRFWKHHPPWTQTKGGLRQDTPAADLAWGKVTVYTSLWDFCGVFFWGGLWVFWGVLGDFCFGFVFFCFCFFGVFLVWSFLRVFCFVLGLLLFWGFLTLYEHDVPYSFKTFKKSCCLRFFPFLYYFVLPVCGEFIAATRTSQSKMVIILWTTRVAQTIAHCVLKAWHP